MKVSKRKKTGLIWKIISLIIAIMLWYFVIQVQNPSDIYLTNNLEITLINNEELTNNGLCVYDMEDTILTARLTGKKILLGEIRKYESQIKGIVDLKDYFNDNKKVIDGEVYLPVKVELPDAINSYAKVEKQSIDFVKIYFDKEIKETKEVTLETKNLLGESFVFDSNRIKIMPKKVEIKGAKNIVDKVDKVIASISMSTIDKSTYDVEVKAYNSTEDKYENVEINPSKIQVDIPILKQKNVKLSLEVTNKLGDEYELESVTFQPSDIFIGASLKEYDTLPDTVSIPLNIIEEEGRHEVEAKLTLDENLFNVKGIDKVKVVYNVIKK